MMKLNKEYIKTTLDEEKLWKVGESDTFRHNDWTITLRKEEENYAPFKFSVSGEKDNSLETWSRRYVSMESAFLHILNNFNENRNIANKYESISDWK